jgi:hypothetical protein
LEEEGEREKERESERWGGVSSKQRPKQLHTEHDDDDI